MDENFLFDKYISVFRLDQEVLLDLLHKNREMRTSIVALVNTRRLKRKELAAILGMTVKGLREKLRSENLNFEECRALLEAFDSHAANASDVKGKDCDDGCSN